VAAEIFHSAEFKVICKSVVVIGQRCVIHKNSSIFFASGRWPRRFRLQVFRQLRQAGDGRGVSACRSSVCFVRREMTAAFAA
jgi:hypothetical protein